MGRLARWAAELGIAGKFSFTNCILVPGDYHTRDIDWLELKQRATGYDKVIALGGFPSDALKKLGIEHFKLPHPSGRNRLLNDKSFEREQLHLCKEYLDAAYP